MKTYYMNFLKFATAVDLIASDIRKSNIQFHKIYGIARGGLPLAVALSHKLNVPMDVVKWSLRDFKDRDLGNLPNDLFAGKKVLLVDDIIDSGVTMHEISFNLGEYNSTDLKIACWIYNVDQDIKPDYFADSIDRSVDKTWFEFWWER